MRPARICSDIEKVRHFSNAEAGHLSNTSIELVLRKFSYPNNVIFRKGYFPDAANGIDEIFCFVNIDFDLFNPTLAALEWFCPKMAKGGIMVIHGYYSKAYKAIRGCVDSFCKK